jgi:hypothetical protein
MQNIDALARRPKRRLAPPLGPTPPDGATIMDGASFHSTITTNPHNLSVGDLVDRLGHANAVLANAKSTEDARQAAWIALGVNQAASAFFRGTVTQCHRCTISADAIRQEMEVRR